MSTKIKPVCKMKYLRSILFILIFLLFAGRGLFAQGRFSFGAGGAFPTGNFASSDVTNSEAGGASAGIAVILRYSWSFSDNGLGLFGGVDLYHNTLSVDVRNILRQEFLAAGIANADYRFYSYFNIPVTTGLMFTQRINQKLIVLANLGVAGDIMKTSDLIVKVNKDEVARAKFSPDMKVGFKVGGGIRFNERTTLSVDYLGLGKHKTTAKVSGSGDTAQINAEQQVNILTVTLGVKVL